MKQIYEGSTPKRHCSHVIAFEKDGAIYLKCRICKRWVRLELKKYAHELRESGEGSSCYNL